MGGGYRNLIDVVFNCLFSKRSTSGIYIMGQGIFTREALKCSGKYRGASEIGRPVKGGGRKILDVSRRGGAKNFGLPQKGGAKNFRVDQFFFNVPKTQFFHVLGVFWALFIFWSKGGKKFQTFREGGGRTILDVSSREGEKF